MSSFKVSRLFRPKNITPDSIHVVYYKEDVDLRFGKLKGRIMGIAPHPFQGSGERGSAYGHTLFPKDFNLLEKLLTGEITIDVEASKPNQMSTKEVPDLNRQEGTKIATSSDRAWKESQFYQKPAKKEIYEQYVKSFLVEFTKKTRHIPVRTQLDFYPSSLLFPTTVSVLVGRDALALIFNGPNRPEDCQVNIDTESILDELLIPHPNGKKYEIKGPQSILLSICNDDHYKYIRGRWTSHGTEWGNPRFICKERKYHAFWEQIKWYRKYCDGTTCEREIPFGEIFGDISEENFTEARARERARKYAVQWVMLSILGRQDKQPKELRTILNQLDSLINQANISETEIEKFLDQNRWIIERGLGYKHYHSQINIPHHLLSSGKKGIKPDKFLERHDGSSDILDLKRVDTNLLVIKVNRSHASAKLTEAEAQIEQYCKFVREPKVREYLGGKGIKILSPRGIALIGRRPNNEILEEWENIKERLAISAFTYDDLLDEIETLVKWVEKISI